MDYKIAYIEILEKLRNFLDCWKNYPPDNNSYEDVIEDLEYRVPELKESEDERIRKRLFEYFKNRKAEGDEDETWYGISYDKILAWLEKQGEQKPHNICDTCENRYGCVNPCPVKLIGQNSSDKVEPKFKVGDTICPKGSMAEFTIESIDAENYYGKGWRLPISAEDDYELVEQNPAWSEEDEKTIDEAVECIEKYAEYVQGGNSKRYVLDLANRVESLVPQNTWKPSDEQMESLELLSRGEGSRHIILRSLYNELKKLKG